MTGRQPIHGIVALLAMSFAQGNTAPGQEPLTWPAPTSNSLREQVTHELARYYADLSARDWEAFADHFWPGATLITTWTPPGEAAPRVEATTVPEFVRRAPLGPDSKPIFEERMLDVAVTGYANLAQAWIRYEARFGAPDDVVEWRGVDAATLMKHDGRWRIVSLSFTK